MNDQSGEQQAVPNAPVHDVEGSTELLFWHVKDEVTSTKSFLIGLCKLPLLRTGGKLVSKRLEQIAPSGSGLGRRT
jgi:hypothetical protein